MKQSLELTGFGLPPVVGERTSPGTSQAGSALPAAVPARRRSSASHFLRHLGEMTLVMMLGMAVLGMASQAGLAALGLDDDRGLLARPEVSALIMAVNMTLPMVWWMRHRRHSWSYAAEMAAAMLIPVLALTPPLWMGLISGDTLSAIQHMIMIPSMAAVMLRRRKELAR